MNKRVFRYTNTFRKDYKLLVKQHKDMSKLDHVLILLQMGIELDTKYKNHKLVNSKNIMIVGNVILNQTGY